MKCRSSEDEFKLELPETGTFTDGPIQVPLTQVKFNGGTPRHSLLIGDSTKVGTQFGDSSGEEESEEAEDGVSASDGGRVGKGEDSSWGNGDSESGSGAMPEAMTGTSMTGAIVFTGVAVGVGVGVGVGELEGVFVGDVGGSGTGRKKGVEVGIMLGVGNGNGDGDGVETGVNVGVGVGVEVGIKVGADVGVDTGVNGIGYADGDGCGVGDGMN